MLPSPRGVVMEEDCCSTQLIDGDGGFNVMDLENFAKRPSSRSAGSLMPSWQLWDLRAAVDFQNFLCDYPLFFAVAELANVYL